MNVIDLIRQHEGLRLLPYECTAGKLTIGYGRNLEDNGLSKDEAEYLLRNDISVVTKELDGAFHWMTDLCYVRRSVLIDMAFNIGLPRLKGFKKTLAHIQSGDFESAAHEMLDSKWARQVGRRADRLADMMRSGLWPEGV